MQRLAAKRRSMQSIRASCLQESGWPRVRLRGQGGASGVASGEGFSRVFEVCFLQRVSRQCTNGWTHPDSMVGVY
eukprot:2441033-Alexandrium_andersonii.AAC.1